MDPMDMNANKRMALSEPDLAVLKEHSVREYPFECCGVILGIPGEPERTRIRKCTNIQNRLHENDPAQFPRDARTAYYIDPKELLSIFKEAEEDSLKVIGFYHSHPDHEAYFSQEDYRLAMFGDEPSYPEASYIIISVFDRAVREMAVFTWNPGKKTYEKQSIS
jgi:proteasome lid subunit RPN8/RPN11